MPILERAVGPDVQPRLLRRLQPGAHQPGRQAASPDDDQEDHVGLDAGGRRLRRLAVREHRQGRHAQGIEHPRRRSGQGDREHAARRQHRADQRAGADLQPPRHRHRGSAARPPAPSGTSCRSGPAWSAVIASASIPYYLTHKAQEIGYHPEMILAGRRINDNMAIYVAERVAQLMIRKRIHVKGSRILMMGLTFKENCPDLRNSKVADVVRELAKYGAKVDVYDPWVDAAEARARVRHQADPQAGQGPLRRDRARGRAQGVPRDGHRHDPQLRAQARTCCTTSSTCSMRTRWTDGSEALRRGWRCASARACAAQTGCPHACGSGRRASRRDFCDIAERRGVAQRSAPARQRSPVAFPARPATPRAACRQCTNSPRLRRGPAFSDAARDRHRCATQLPGRARAARRWAVAASPRRLWRPAQSSAARRPGLRGWDLSWSIVVRNRDRCRVPLNARSAETRR